MAKKLLNDAEALLFKRWPEAIQIEEAIGEIRVKYEAACQEVIDIIRKDEPKLDLHQNRVSRTTGPNKGAIFVGRKRWPGGKRYPIGFYVEHLRLDQLTDPEYPASAASLWIGSGGDAELERKLVSVRQSVSQEIDRRLTAEERASLAKTSSDEDYVASIVLPKATLVELLLGNDSRQFVDYLVTQLETLVKLLPAIDQAFAPVST